MNFFVWFGPVHKAITNSHQNTFLSATLFGMTVADSASRAGKRIEEVHSKRVGPFAAPQEQRIFLAREVWNGAQEQ
jgi:hypothetical protein